MSLGGGQEPKWAADGATLFFRSPTDLMAAAIDSGPTFAPGTPEAVVSLEDYLILQRFEYDVLPDGERFLLKKRVLADDDSALPQLIVVQNWFTELERLVPTN